MIRRKHSERVLAGEALERRFCLSAVAFLPHEIISNEANGAATVLPVDLDTDGDMDVLITRGGFSGPGSNKVAWYENTDGKGTFGAQKAIATTRYWTARVDVADIDNDGDMDLLIAGLLDLETRQSPTIEWYENTDGNGNFRQRTAIDAGDVRVNSATTSDVDGDGDADVLIADEHDKIAWYENTDGKGNFGPQIVISTAVRRPSSVDTADVDGDGDVDVLSTSRWDGKIAWYENIDGKGEFGPQQVINSKARNPRSVQAIDFDGDGDLDLWSVATDDGKIAWYENTDGNGGFGQERTIDQFGHGKVMATEVVDFDGDGDVDVIVVSWDKTAVYENLDGNATFSEGKTLNALDALTDRASSLHLADLDGDHDMDILYSSFWADTVGWFENIDGRGDFGSQTVISKAAASEVRSVYAADLDGDGDPDVLSASSGDGKIAWYENADSRGTFGQQQVITTAADGAWSVFAADIDGDGDIDVLSASFENNQIAWYENTDGRGTFGPPKVITTFAEGASSVFASDLDGDGDLDVLSASTWNGAILWYENTDGRGTFGEEKDVGGADYTNSVHAADMDGDGDVDVLSSSREDQTIIWYENTDGRGHFDVEHVYRTDADYTGNVSAADLDGDGDMDVVAAFWDSKKAVGWYENVDGKGRLGPLKVVDSSCEAAISAYVADFDGDSDLDIVSTALFGSPAVGWYENLDGRGNFAPRRAVGNLPIGADAVYATDLDGDGDADVIAGSGPFDLTASDDTILWYENRLVGDSNDDGVFDSADLVVVFHAGKYEDGIPDNATFDEGDWNQDGDFTTADLVLTFQAGRYITTARPMASAIAAAIEQVFADEDRKSVLG